MEVALLNCGGRGYKNSPCDTPKQKRDSLELENCSQSYNSDLLGIVELDLVDGKDLCWFAPKLVCSDRQGWWLAARVSSVRMQEELNSGDARRLRSEMRWGWVYRQGDHERYTWGGEWMQANKDLMPPRSLEHMHLHEYYQRSQWGFKTPWEKVPSGKGEANRQHMFSQKHCWPTLLQLETSRKHSCSLYWERVSLYLS